MTEDLMRRWMSVRRGKGPDKYKREREEEIKALKVRSEGSLM